jgi:uncharacterized protein YcbK (DUF882 family)
MGDLTENFSRHEFACKCGCGFDGIDMDLVRSLQVLRDLLPPLANGRRRRIMLNSGCRCEAHNRRSGGSPTSRHLRGQAADIRAEGMKPAELYRYACKVRRFERGGIGLYPTFLHVDVRATRGRWGWKPGVGMVAIQECL